MANRSGGVALRLGMEADGSVKSTFDDIEKNGSATAKRLVAEYTRAGEDMEKALARRDRAGTQITAMAGGYKLGTDQNAQVQAYAKVMADAERQAAALRAVIDPLSVAQGNYDRELETANRLLRLGKISEQEHATAVQTSTRALEQARAEQSRGAANDNARRASIQNLGFQLQDFAVQVSGGTSVMRAFAQQAPQAMGAIAAMGGSAEGTASKFSKFAAFLGGPWGVAVTVATTVVAGLADHLLHSGDSADAATKGLNKYSNSLVDMKKRAEEARAAIANLNVSVGQQRLNQITDTQNDMLLAEARVSQLQRQIGSTGYTAGSSRSANFGLDRAPDTSAARRELADEQAILDQRRQELSILQANDKRMREQEAQRGTASASSIIEKQVALATATTATERARAAYNLVLARGADADRQGAAAQAKYRADLTAASQALNAAEAADKSAAAGKRELARDTRAAAKAHQEMADAVRQLMERSEYGGDAAANAYVKRMNAIRTLFGKGEISIDEATSAGIIAGNDYMDGVERAVQERHTRFAATLSTTLTAAGGLGSLVSDDAMKAMTDRAMKAIAAVGQVSPALQKLRASGVEFVDSVLKPSSWREWGASGKSVIKELGDELFKLALINPLKNLIGGTNKNGTISSLISGVAGLFGGGKAPDRSIDTFAFASGTEYAPGGVSLVGEFGKELVNLPRGARVTPAAETRRLMEGSGAARQAPYFDLRGAVMTEDLLRQMNDISTAHVEGAAPGIAHGAAQLASSNEARRRQYRIPGR